MSSQDLEEVMYISSYTIMAELVQQLLSINDKFSESFMTYILVTRDIEE
jgi:hypothetical protein